MTVTRPAAVAVAVLALAASCSLGEKGETASSPGPVASRKSFRTFSDRGISLRYPSEWTVTRFSRTNRPRRLAVASYRLPAAAVEGDCGGWQAVDVLPRDGALVIMIDYGTIATGDFPTRPRRFRLGDGEYHNYECFGRSTMFRFRIGRRALHWHIALGADAPRSRARDALDVLGSAAVR